MRDVRLERALQRRDACVRQSVAVERRVQLFVRRVVPLHVADHQHDVRRRRSVDHPAAFVGVDAHRLLDEDVPTRLGGGDRRGRVAAGRQARGRRRGPLRADRRRRVPLAPRGTSRRRARARAARCRRAPARRSDRRAPAGTEGASPERPARSPTTPVLSRFTRSASLSWNVPESGDYDASRPTVKFLTARVETGLTSPDWSVPPLRVPSHLEDRPAHRRARPADAQRSASTGARNAASRRSSSASAAIRTTPHVDLTLLGDAAGRERLLALLAERELELAALNVSGNPLHPDRAIGARHDAELRGAVQLAHALGVPRVVAMSGCPGAPGGGGLAGLRRWRLAPRHGGSLGLAVDAHRAVLARAVAVRRCERARRRRLPRAPPGDVDLQRRVVPAAARASPGTTCA